jgi:ABC-type transport system involved in cytochrome bd biosynthesis fused ATPase/permease subunit
MTSAAVAVTLSAWRAARPVAGLCFALITLVFVYTTLVNVIERPDGLKIGAFFIVAIILSSLVSRVWRTTELRVEKITLDTQAQRFLDEMDAQGELRIIANQPRQCDDAEYTHREQEQREDNNIPSDAVLTNAKLGIGIADRHTRPSQSRTH